MTRQAFASMLEDFQRDTRWLNKNYDEVKQSYPEEYVAVHNERVVDHDSDLDRLMARLEEKHPGKSSKMAIEYVTTKKVEMVLCG